VSDRSRAAGGPLRLRREVATLRTEREILKKAAAWFAQETGSIPPKDSSS